MYIYTYVMFLYFIIINFSNFVFFYFEVCIHSILSVMNNFSLPNCYEVEFKEQLEIVENGVPLEHLVSCLSSVELRQDIGCVKYIVWIGKKEQENNHEGNYLFYRN